MDPWELVVAKFVPGLNAELLPSRDSRGMPLRRFALFDGLGMMLWAGGYIGTGYIFSGELERVAARLAFLGRGLTSLLLAGLLLYIGWKYFKTAPGFCTSMPSRASVRKNSINELIPESDLVVVDLRHAIEFESQPETIPGGSPHGRGGTRAKLLTCCCATAKSCFSAPAQTKPPLPKWPCVCSQPRNQEKIRTNPWRGPEGLEKQADSRCRVRRIGRR